MLTSGSESRSGLVMELAEEFLDRYRKGERPALREYIENHPELAGEIREVFPAMAMMENIALADESLEGDATGDLPVRRLPPLEQLGDYRIVREVGRGGMGVVYEAEQVSLGRHVALKVLPPQLLRDARTRRRFEREARAAAKLHHTNIVPVFGVGEQGETPYYVMQFIQGQGLDVVLEELKRLRAGGAEAPAAPALSTVGRDVSAADVARSLLTGRLDAQPTEGSAADNGQDHRPADTAGSDSGHASSLSSSSLTLPGAEQARGKARRQTYWQGVARIGVQVADALAYAHAQGIVHRDIKPSNLLLDTHGIVWVTDFGLAKADDQQNLTHTGDILGTLRYMPPEAFGGKVDSRGDVYALGLTLYEMLAFRPAFDEKERGRLVKQVTNEAPAPLRKLNAEVPRDLETIVQKAIEREPSHRYASASELDDDLRRFVDDEPIRARRASYGERLARWARRNPAIAALGIAVALLTFAVMGGLWYGNQSAREALKVQTALRREADERARQAAAAEARADAQAGEARRAAAATGAANRALTSTQDSLRRTLYAAHINLAQAAWDSGSTTRMLDLLEATRPKPGEPDFRGFEWNYYRRQAHGELAVRKLPAYELRDDRPRLPVPPVLSDDGALVGRLLSPHGRTSPPLLVIHETATGRLLRQIPLLALAGDDTRNGMATRLSFSGDGARLALVSANADTSSRTGTGDITFELHAFVWSVADGRELLHDSWTSTPARSVVAGVALTREGGRLALTTYQPAGSYTGRSEMSGDLRVLDVADGRERIHLTSQSEGYDYPALSPDGRFVTTSGRSYRGGASTVSPSRLVLLEVESGRSRTDLEEPAIPAGSAYFSPDGRFLAVVTQDSVRSFATALVVCDLAAGRRVATEQLPGSLAYLTGVGFSRDGRGLILASRGDTVCEVREVASGRLLRKLSLGATGTEDLAIRPSDGRLITVDAASNIREWPSPSARAETPDSGGVVERAGEAALGFGGRALVAMQSPSGPNEPTRFAVHDVATGQVLRRFERRVPGTPTRIGLRAPLMTLTFGSLGSRFVFPVVTDDPRTTDHFEVWDSATGQQIARLDAVALGGGLPSSTSLSAPMALDAGATRLAVPVQMTERRVGDRGEFVGGDAMAIVELPSGRLLRKIPLAQRAGGMALSPDGRVLAATTLDVNSTGERRPGIQLHDTDSGRMVRTLQGSLRSVDKLAFSPDGRQLAAAKLNAAPSGPIEVWNLAAGAAPVPIHLDGHAYFVRDLAFSADGRRLASLANRNDLANGELKLWDTTSGRDLVTWALPPGWPVMLAFDGDHRLRVLLLARGASEARMMLFDASPLTPAVEAIDVVDRLGPKVPLKSALAERIQAEPGLDPAVRSAALALVPLRQESWLWLVRAAYNWPDGSPELQHRALVYAERAFELAPDMGSLDLRTLGEARYRNGKLAECLEPLRRSLALQVEENWPAAERIPRALVFIAMAEAKLGHREAAQAALDDYRTRLNRLSGGSTAKPPEDSLLAEAEAVLRDAHGVPPAAVTTPAAPSPKP
jgi:serine/threonine protein kinase/WD40 repeat protein